MTVSISYNSSIGTYLRDTFTIWLLVHVDIGDVQFSIECILKNQSNDMCAMSHTVAYSGILQLLEPRLVTTLSQPIQDLNPFSCIPDVIVFFVKATIEDGDFDGYR